MFETLKGESLRFINQEKWLLPKIIEAKNPKTT